MAYTLRRARPAEAVKIARMLHTSLQRGLEGGFTIDRSRLLADVVRVINSSNGFSLVLADGEELVGCFMAELQAHSYCNGYIARELGVFIEDGHRGRHLEPMLRSFVEWADTKPDVLFKSFNIGQLGPTTPYVRAVLRRAGFKQGDEGYYLK